METASVPAYSGRQQQSSSQENQVEHPKIITAFMYIPKKNYFLLNLELRNRLGDVAAVSRVLADANIEVLTGSFTRGAGGKPGSWQVFVQPLNPMTSDEMKRLLLSCPDVVGVQTKESRDGLLVDSVTFPIKVSSGQRAMIIRNDVWNSMLQKTREKFGSGGDVIIYEQGNMAGRMSGKELFVALGRTFLTQQLDQVIAMYQALGWGRAKILSFSQSPLSVTIRMWDSAECMGQKSDKPTGHFVRGHIAGNIEEIFGIECKCVETNCLARGNSYCEFVLEEKKRVLSK